MSSRNAEVSNVVKLFLFLFSVCFLLVRFLVPYLLGNRSSIAGWSLCCHLSLGSCSVVHATQCITEKPPLVGGDADEPACNQRWVAAYPVAWYARAPPCSGGRACVPIAELQAFLDAVVMCSLAKSVAHSDSTTGIQHKSGTDD